DGVAAARAITEPRRPPAHEAETDPSSIAVGRPRVVDRDLNGVGARQASERRLDHPALRGVLERGRSEDERASAAASGDRAGGRHTLGAGLEELTQNPARRL